MSINFKSVIGFSHYVDKANIRISHEREPILEVPKHRFSIYIPYKKRESGPVATVIMYNPSKAGLKNEQGRRMSDFTVYNVLQYLYHHKDKYKGVRIMNLFSSYSSDPTRLTSSSLNHPSNNRTLKSRISKINHERGDKLILAWGNPPKSVTTEIKNLYKKQIKFIESVIGDYPVFHVEDPYRISDAPQHGSRWTDYEKLKPYHF